MIPSLLLGWLVTRGGGDSVGPDLGVPGPLVAVMVVLVSPAIETMLMAGPVYWLSRRAGPAVAAVGSAVGWGVAHSLLAPVWGLVIWWPFLIFSIAFIAWARRGYWQAIGTVAAMHVLQNLAPMAILLATR